MAGTLTSERERDALRSFTRRIDPSDAGAHNNLGVLYYNKALYPEAVGAFMKALELDPKMQVAQRNLEIAYFNTGFYDQRVAELRERVRARPDDRDARWELGRTYALLGQNDAAVTEFTALLEYHPADVAALIQMALAEKSGGQYQEAQRYLERAVELDPDSAVVNLYLGEILYNRGLNDEALARLERAAALGPDNADALYLMGFVLGDMGRHEDARAVAKRAMALNPSLSRAQANLSLDQYRPERYEALVAQRQERKSRQMEVVREEQLAHYNLGLAFRQKGYYTEAQREYRIALDRGEDRELVLQAMAEVHLLRRDPVAAVELYDRLLAERTDSPKLWNERGIALHQAGRVEEAAESYQRATAEERGYALAHNNLGVAHYHLGRHDAAVDALRLALETRPAFVKARLNLALLLVVAKHTQHALEAYRQVLAVEPENPVAWNGIGLVLSDMKKFDDARNAFSRAIDARPAYAEAHYNLSFTLSNLGDFEGALRETKRALELDPYYVKQKFELAIDLEYEDPDMSIRPELDGETRVDSDIAEFSFDSARLETLFEELKPIAPAPTEAPVAEARPFAIARDYLAKGLLDRAAAEVSRALQRGAPQDDGLALLGNVFARQGLYGEALERFREARTLAPDNATAQLGEAASLLRLNRASEARPLAEAALAAAPEDIDRLMLVATARAETGDPAAALNALDVARRVAPMRPDVHHKIAEIAESLGDFEGAIGSYRHALALDSDLAIVRVRLARLLSQKGMLKDAEHELLAALDTVPTYAEASLELAVLRRRTYRPADALSLLVELLVRDPYHLEALVALGETLLQLGQRRDAATAFARVLRFNPDHAAALYHEGRWFADQRDYAAALTRWERVVTLDPAGEYARMAKRDARTAQDLRAILGRRREA
ncbi:MAG: tetratricopeptide repeat protein [Gemmatimonadaceae bacterium]|nr:tetratricopeptide repeat protein [Gemmatimonadaceae bacterium]